MLIHAGCGAILPQPLLAILVQQAALMWAISNSRAYCSTPLLEHPLSQQRMQHVASALDALTGLAAPLALMHARHGELGAGQGGRAGPWDDAWRPCCMLPPHSMS